MGIGYNKLSAKISSEINKPNGFYIMKNEEQFIEYMKDKAIRKIPGIGGKTELMLNRYGVYRIDDLINKSLIELQGIFGHGRGIQLYENVRGIDHSPVANERQHKSIGNETTLNSPVRNEEFIKESLKKIFDGVCQRLKEKDFFSKTLTIKIRYSNRETIQKSKSLKEYSKSYSDFYRIFNELLDDLNLDAEIILYGFTFSNLQEKVQEQLSFTDIKKLKKTIKLLVYRKKLKRWKKR